MGEALNQLMLAGDRVFDDFLITNKLRRIRNIDLGIMAGTGSLLWKLKCAAK